MTHFAFPYLLFAPLLFAIIGVLRRQRSQSALFADTHLLANAGRSFRMIVRGPSLFLLSAITIISLSIAAARPQRISTIPQLAKSRNIILALDISGSMKTRDFSSDYGTMSRLEGVKAVVQEFIKNRPFDRIGLVVFGRSAFLQSPLTLDHSVVSEQVGMLEEGMAGDGTAIGEGLGLSLKHIEKIEGDAKAVILITDGVNNAGQVKPIPAANIAHDLDIKVHTIGIGAQDKAAQGQGFWGDPFASQAEFDETTLQEIARITGGVYFNARSLEGLKKVYQEIDTLEQSEREEPQRLVEELFTPFALAGAIAYLLYTILVRSYFLKVP